MTALGSGIYSPSGPIHFTYNPAGGEELIVAKVPILSASTEAKPRLGVGRGEVGLVEISYMFENISGYSRAPLVRGSQEILTLCHGQTFCCQASYYLLGDSYHLLVYQGLREMAVPGMKIPIQLCGVARLCCEERGVCTVCPPGGATTDTAHLLSLTSRDYALDSLVLPSVLDQTGQLADWNKIALDRTQADEGENKLLLNSSIFLEPI